MSSTGLVKTGGTCVDCSNLTPPATGITLVPIHVGIRPK